MAVTIKAVEKRSPCYKKGVRSGWQLEKINGEDVVDVLDYRFYIKSERLELLFKNEKGKEKLVHLKKKEEDDIGLEFETYLMDRETHCTNKCVFCFIDQMPPGMRDSLYFKDDDSRLSFLFGNYITLTNLSQRDVDRIIKMHISPVNVSVHTMNPELRKAMMKNRFAGTSLEALKTFAEHDIKLNTQLVLCPGINDGKELEFSLRKLAELFPAIQSIACVPVGLTKFRDNLPALELYDKDTASTVIETVDRFASEFLERHGTRLAFCSDEFYLLAGKPIPGEEYYEDYPQLENGVGLCRSLETEFFDALDSSEICEDKGAVSLATGTAAAPLIKKLAEAAKSKLPNVSFSVYEIKNDFFGHSVTVAGLITGQDLMKNLKGRELGEKLIIPSVMLKADEDIFLDDVTLEELESELGVKIEPVENDGYALFEALHV